MGIFDIFQKKESSFESFYQKIDNQQSSWRFFAEVESELFNWNDEQKSLLIIDILEQIHKNDLKNEWSDRRITYNTLVSCLIKRKIQFGQKAEMLIKYLLENISLVVKSKSQNNNEYNYNFIHIIKPVLTNLLRFHKFENQEEKEILNEIKSELEVFDKCHYNNETKKTIQKIEDILFNGDSNSESNFKPTYFIGDDSFKDYANNIINSLKEDQKQICFQIIAHAQKTSGSKPSKKYLDKSKTIIERFGNEEFKNFSQTLFEFIIGLKETIITHTRNYNGTEYSYNTVEFLDSINIETLKGLVWMNSKYHDNKTIQTISRLAERCFKKIPQKGPAAAGLGNACLYTLYTSKGLDGIAQLSKLKLKIKQNSTLDLIEKYIVDAANKLGISAVEVEDLAVDDFKLKNHKIEILFDNVKAILELIGIGKSIIKWYKEDGKEQKTVPQFVKDKYADKLKKIKDKQKQIDQTTSVQKERFDRMLRSSRKMILHYFKEKYINHGLLSFIINKVIFNFSNDNESRLAIYTNKQWIDLTHNQVNIDKYTHVSLWHPANSSTNEVKEWRQFLMDAQIQQPFKQAHREIYLLTDAEINTRTYSNRMASHILKQHQFVTLAKGRNWKAKLIGGWDDVDQESKAELYLPEYNLKVEYWVNALNADEQFNDIGIWNYVTTDQVRFLNTETNELIELINVPPIAFSEAMRDVDLFVGVASVGNDPTWSDSGGLPYYRDYWQSYSFGDLSEVAKNRKEILIGLIPRLNIASVAQVSDKFLIVKGKIRTYKIHIGSTNILMEPNDQYLCIVSDRSKKNEAENVFLPFEGDNGLSVIISKAFLLANDDKITDTTITSQINR